LLLRRQNQEDLNSGQPRQKVNETLSQKQTEPADTCPYPSYLGDRGRRIKVSVTLYLKNKEKVKSPEAWLKVVKCLPSKMLWVQSLV
jgi:hypothetical protein